MYNNRVTLIFKCEIHPEQNTNMCNYSILPYHSNRSETDEVTQLNVLLFFHLRITQ